MIIRQYLKKLPRKIAWLTFWLTAYMWIEWLQEQS